MYRSETLTRVDMSVNQGYLNRIQVWADNRGRKYISRVQNDDTHEVMENLHDEYSFNGFLNKGGAYRLRSPREQLHFVAEARRAHLRVVPFVGVKDGDLVMPMIAGCDMKTHVNAVKNDRALLYVVRPALNDIATAHVRSRKIVYGDRWLKNILVDRSGGIHHIDFDIEISGPHAPEYEVAQFMYSMVRDTVNKDRLLAALSACGMRKRLKHHDVGVVREFLGRYGSWYEHKHPDDHQQTQAVQQTIGEVLRMM